MSLCETGGRTFGGSCSPCGPCSFRTLVDTGVPVLTLSGVFVPAGGLVKSEMSDEIIGQTPKPLIAATPPNQFFAIGDQLRIVYSFSVNVSGTVNVTGDFSNDDGTIASGVLLVAAPTANTTYTHTFNYTVVAADVARKSITFTLVGTAIVSIGTGVITVVAAAKNLATRTAA